jgi:hypothetical protein
MAFINHLQVVTRNNYNITTISTLYSSLEHILWCSQSVTRRFLAMAPTIIITRAPVQNYQPTRPLFTTSRQGARRKQSFSIVAFVSVAEGTCLPSRSPETALVYVPISR